MKLKDLLKIYQGKIILLIGENELREILNFYSKHGLFDIKYKDLINKFNNNIIYTSYINCNGDFTVIIEY